MSGRHKRAKRACDLCRQRKVRCDGLPDANCTQCTAKGQTCSWTTRQNKRGRKPTTSNKKSLKRKIYESPSSSPKLKSRKLNDENEESSSDKYEIEVDEENDEVKSEGDEDGEIEQKKSDPIIIEKKRERRI